VKVATHKCKVCGALWRLHLPSDTNPWSSWQLVSEKCGACCDNADMGDQIEQLDRRSAWTWAWLAWLALFLAIELPAALRERAGTVYTLSRHVWARWAPRWWQRALVIAFGVEVFVWHFADSGAHWWSGGWAVTALGAPVAALIVWRETWARSGRR
jgi:hypothetical protein